MNEQETFDGGVLLQGGNDLRHEAAIEAGRQVGRHTGRHVNEGESRDEREAALFALGLSEEARGCLFADSQSG